MPSNYPEAVYAIQESRSKHGMLHAFGRDSRLDETHRSTDTCLRNQFMT